MSLSPLAAPSPSSAQVPESIFTVPSSLKADDISPPSPTTNVPRLSNRLL